VVNGWTYESLLVQLWRCWTDYRVSEFAQAGGDDECDLIPVKDTDCPPILGIPDESGLVERLVREGIATLRPRATRTQGLQVSLAIDVARLGRAVAKRQST